LVARPSNLLAATSYARAASCLVLKHYNRNPPSATYRYVAECSYKRC
jgi:hypothetical protein